MRRSNECQYLSSARMTGNPWGNLKQDGTWSFKFKYGANNRIDDYCNGGDSGPKFQYDAAGNMTSDCTHAYTFDAENRILTVDGNAATYTYDSNGQRIRKDVGSNWTEYYYFGGAMLGEYSAAGWTDYIYSNGQLAARANGADPASTFYYHQDHLGTTKLITDSSGAVVSNCTYAPFGQLINCTPDDPGNHYRFTGDEYDSETNTHHTQFRQLSSIQGRWLSPDPYLGSIDPANPQSINRYAYVLNNPMSLIDPLGLNCMSIDGGMFPGPDEGGPGEGLCNEMGGIWVGNTVNVNGTDSSGALLPGSCATVYMDGVYQGVTCGTGASPIAGWTETTGGDGSGDGGSSAVTFNEACPGVSATLNVSGSASSPWPLSWGANAGVLFGVNTTGVTISRGAGATAGLIGFQGGVSMQAGLIDVRATKGAVDFHIQQGSANRFDMSVPVGDGVDGHTVPTGIQFGVGKGFNILPRSFSLSYEDQSKYQNFCVQWKAVPSLVRSFF